MKKLELKYRVILIIGLIFLSIITLYLTLRNENQLYLSKAIKEVFYYPFKDINNQKDLITPSINQELKEENMYLKKELELKNSLMEFTVINALVVNRNPSYWYDTITINKGSKDNILVNMPVVVSEGLVGKIISTTPNTSTIRLLTSINNENKLSVRINTYNKILEVDSNNNLVIKGITKKENIKVNDIIKTSGLTNLYPSGITIGKVKKIENVNYDSGLCAYINLNYDIDNLKFVSVLKRKER